MYRCCPSLQGEYTQRSTAQSYSLSHHEYHYQHNSKMHPYCFVTVHNIVSTKCSKGPTTCLGQDQVMVIQCSRSNFFFIIVILTACRTAVSFVGTTSGSGTLAGCRTLPNCILNNRMKTNSLERVFPLIPKKQK